MLSPCDERPARVKTRNTTPSPIGRIGPACQTALARDSVVDPMAPNLPPPAPSRAAPPAPAGARISSQGGPGPPGGPPAPPVPPARDLPPTGPRPPRPPAPPARPTGGRAHRPRRSGPPAASRRSGPGAGRARATTRRTLVSTAGTATPWAKEATAAAVYGPIPGRRARTAGSEGTRPPCSATMTPAALQRAAARRL